MIENDSDILIFGAAENNLKGIDVRIPLNQITCVTGKSGSGKSSLVKETIARESQRLQSIVTGTASEYEEHVRANFSSIKNLPKCVLITQEQAMRTVNSSVATYSGISDGLRNLFSNEGEIICNCGQVVDSVISKDKITSTLEKLLDDKPYHFYSFISKNKPIDITSINNFYTNYGINKFIVDDNSKELDIDALSKLSKNKNFSLKALIGVAKKSNLSKLNLERFPTKSLQVYHAKNCLFNFKYHTFCYDCLSPYRSKSISLFTRKQLSHDSGACLACSGIGSQKNIDFSILINPDKPITDLNFLNLENNGKAYKYVNLQNSHISRFAKENAIDTSLTFEQTSKLGQKKILSFLACKFENHLEHEHLQELIIENTCSECCGSGFNPYSLSVFYNKKTIADVLSLSLAEALLFFADTELQPTLSALNKLSLGHLSLDRRTNTLSGGELQRLKLTEVIRQRSDSLLLIIDEPSVGLHREDLKNLISLFREIVSQQNTLLIIDHHPWIIANCDHHIKIGPGSGAQGGELITKEKLITEPQKPLIRKTAQKPSAFIAFENINYRNIFQQRIDFPLHQLVCLAGVSGSGKSSLAQYIIQNGQSHFDEIISLSQHSIGKNKRSTIATYLDIADEIRATYATTEKSKFLDINKSIFNNNTQASTCKSCAGLNQSSDVLCNNCINQGFDPLILSITIDEININDFMQIPINELEEATPSLFARKKIKKAIRTLIEIGLGHLSLGRQIPSISGGEAQRVKLAKYLTKHNSSITTPQKHNLLILDEPTRGLNKEDSLVILDLLNKLLAYKNSILVIEHNDIILENSDFIIELGPKAGTLGGRVTFSGKPDDFVIRKPNYETNKKKTTRSAGPTQLYPSAITHNTIDSTYFEKLDQFFASYRLLSQEPKVIHFHNKEQMLKYYHSNFKANKIHFNPFNSLFINSPLISRKDIETITLRLKKLMLHEISIAGCSASLSQASKLINNQNCWSVLVEVDDFNLAFELGGGWIIVQSQGDFWHLSVPMLSLQERIFSPRHISKNSFNLFYNKCQYCNGKGEVDLSDGYISDPKLSILDTDFYHTDFTQAMKTKLIRKLKTINSTFSKQGLFDFSKPFNKLNKQELFIYNQGLPMHQFLKPGGRDTAKGDMIAWPGMTRFFLENIKYFSAQSQKYLLSSLKREQCPACCGSKYNQRLNHYLKNMHSERNHSNEPKSH